MNEGVTISRSDRVSIDDAVINIYRELTEGSNIEQAPFRTLKDVFMLAVVLGYRGGVPRRAAPSGARHTIRKEVFSENDYHLLKAIAIATTGDVEVLMDQGKVLTIAEEYAQVGIHQVKAELLEQGGRPLWNLVSLSSVG
jgi:dnd system-associated protein 4